MESFTFLSFLNIPGTHYRYTDYLSAGSVLCETGPLLNEPVTATVTAETATQLYFIHVTDLEMAFDMYPSVKVKLWKTTAIRMILSMLSQKPDIQVCLIKLVGL